MNKRIKIEVSARHVHISKEDLDVLFGVNHELTKYKDLSVDGEFASNETVTLLSDNNNIENVRILGPLREKTQVELTLTDARKLKIVAPVRISGDLDNTPGIRIKGPIGELFLDSGVMVAKRHFHCSPGTALELSLKDGDNIMVKTSGTRGLIFDNIEVRVAKEFHDVIHLDTDEGNACSEDGVCMFGEIVGE